MKRVTGCQDTQDMATTSKRSKMDEEIYYTFIIKTDGENLPDRAEFNLMGEHGNLDISNTMIVSHGNHAHVLYQSSENNSKRKLQRIINKLVEKYSIQENNPNADIFAIFSFAILSKIRILDIKAYIKYLATKYNRLSEEEQFVLYDGRTMDTMYADFCQYLIYDRRNEFSTSDEIDCGNVSELRRRVTRESRKFKEEGNIQKLQNLYNFCEDMNIESLEDLDEWIGGDSARLAELRGKYGTYWRKTVDEYCQTIVAAKKKYAKRSSAMKTFKEAVNSFECPGIKKDATRVEHDENVDEGAQWLLNLFEENSINPESFLNDVNTIFQCKKLRVNALVLEGPSTTGKTLLAKLITTPYDVGLVGRSGDATPFYLENLYRHHIALMEEPNITPVSCGDFKELLGGADFTIQRKGKSSVTLERMPVIITTNHPLWYNLRNSGDIEPIKKRCITYRLTNRLTPEKLYKSNICLCTLKRLFEVLEH